jgi:hypothetical protein
MSNNSIISRSSILRRKTKQLIEQGVERYQAESEELLKKHNKRWAAKFGNVCTLSFALLPLDCM